MSYIIEKLTCRNMHAGVLITIIGTCSVVYLYQFVLVLIKPLSKSTDQYTALEY